MIVLQFTPHVGTFIKFILCVCISFCISANSSRKGTALKKHYENIVVYIYLYHYCLSNSGGLSVIYPCFSADSALFSADIALF